MLQSIIHLVIDNALLIRKLIYKTRELFVNQNPEKEYLNKSGQKAEENPVSKKLRPVLKLVVGVDPNTHFHYIDVVIH